MRPDKNIPKDGEMRRGGACAALDNREGLNKIVSQDEELHANDYRYIRNAVAVVEGVNNGRINGKEWCALNESVFVAGKAGGKDVPSENEANGTGVRANDMST